MYSKIDEIDFTTVGVTQTQTQASPPFDILVEHYQNQYDVLSAAGMIKISGNDNGVLSSETWDIFNTVMENVSDVTVGYLRKEFNSPVGELIPVWRICISGAKFYYHLFSGDPEGYKL